MTPATQRRLSHDLRGSLANLRIGLQACQENPQLFAELHSALLDEVERLDHRLFQLGWMARCSDPHKQECLLPALLAAWTQERGLAEVDCPAVRVMLDPDLMGVAFDQLCDNAERHGGGVTGVRVVVSQDSWQLHVGDRGPGWPEGLEEWLRDPQLWRGQIALGLPLAQRVLASHQGRILLDQSPAGWIAHGVV